MFKIENLDAIADLMEYLMAVQKTGRAVFFNYSGHVDSIDIRVVKSAEDYGEVIYAKYPTIQYFSDRSEEEFREDVNSVMGDIETSINEYELKQQELKQLEILKAKYEPKGVANVEISES